jgi:hypothetical protein
MFTFFTIEEEARKRDYSSKGSRSAFSQYIRADKFLSGGCAKAEIGRTMVSKLVIDALLTHSPLPISRDRVRLRFYIKFPRSG